MKVKVCRSSPALYITLSECPHINEGGCRCVEKEHNIGYLHDISPKIGLFGIPADLKDGEVREMEWQTPLGPVRTCETCIRSAYASVACEHCRDYDKWTPKKTED